MLQKQKIKRDPCAVCAEGVATSQLTKMDMDDIPFLDTLIAPRIEQEIGNPPPLPQPSHKSISLSGSNLFKLTLVWQRQERCLRDIT